MSESHRDDNQRYRYASRTEEPSGAFFRPWFTDLFGRVTKARETSNPYHCQRQIMTVPKPKSKEHTVRRSAHLLMRRRVRVTMLKLTLHTF